MTIKMRTLRNIELRSEGWLFEKSSDENVVGANRIEQGSALPHLFDLVTFAEGVIFEDLIKMFLNYQELQSLNPFIKDILEEYDSIKDLEVESYQYPTLSFERHIIDQVQTFTEDCGFYGYDPTTPDLRYEIYFENIEDVLKLPVFITHIINTYVDNENDILDASMFDFYSCDLSTIIKALVLNLQEMGNREEKIEEKKKYLEEEAAESAPKKNKIKLKLVKNDEKDSSKE